MGGSLKAPHSHWLGDMMCVWGGGTTNPMAGWSINTARAIVLSQNPWIHGK